MTEETQKVSHSTTEFWKKEGIVPMQRKIQIRKNSEYELRGDAAFLSDEAPRSGSYLKQANYRERQGGSLPPPRR